MLFLAYKIISATTDITDIDTKRKPLTFFQAALFQWVNPKAWVMAIGAISTYTSINSNMLEQVLIICLLFLVLGLPCIAIWLFGGVALRKYMKNPRHMRIINLILGSLLALSIVLVLF